MNILQQILIPGILLSALLISYVEAKNKCSFTDQKDCTTAFCNNDPTKPCLWNKPLKQCRCPLEGPDHDNCGKVNDPTKCGETSCINIDGVEVGCVVNVVEDDHIPEIFKKPDNKKRCKCPPTCSIEGKKTCSKEETCGDSTKVCDKGFEGQSCSCRVKCGLECNIANQDCESGCICLPNIEKNGNICQRYVVDSPCDCTKNKCGSTDYVCIPSQTEIFGFCGTCKATLSDCCKKDSDCVQGICNGHGKCKLECGEICNPSKSKDQCDNSKNLSCQETMAGSGIYLCLKVEHQT